MKLINSILFHTHQTFRRVPKKPEIREKWIEAIRSSNQADYNGNGFVCSLHFDENLVLKKSNDRCKLSETAIPTIFSVSVEQNSSQETDPVYDKFSLLNDAPDHLLFKTKTSYEIKIMKLQKEMDMWQNKCKKQREEIHALKKKVDDLSKVEEQLKHTNECLEQQLQAKTLHVVPQVKQFS